MSRTRLAPLFVALAALAALLAGCGRQAPATAAAAPANAPADPDGPSLFTIPAAQMGHLSLYTVAPTTLVRTLRLPGTVAYNGFHTTAVITQVGGRVTRILAQPGEHVRAGQPMLYVSSPDYSADRAAF